MKEAFAEQRQKLCFSALSLLPTADSRSNYVELGSSGILPLLAREDVCVDRNIN